MMMMMLVMPTVIGAYDQALVSPVTSTVSVMTICRCE